MFRIKKIIQMNKVPGTESRRRLVTVGIPYNSCDNTSPRPYMPIRHVVHIVLLFNFLILISYDLPNQAGLDFERPGYDLATQTLWRRHDGYTYAFLGSPLKIDYLNQPIITKYWYASWYESKTSFLCTKYLTLPSKKALKKPYSFDLLFTLTATATSQPAG